MKITNDYLKPKKDPYLHSSAHVLADELMNRLSDTKHYGFYLRMAVKYDHNLLRRLAGEVLEQHAKNPGALFAFLIKKNNDEIKKKIEEANSPTV